MDKAINKLKGSIKFDPSDGHQLQRKDDSQFQLESGIKITEYNLMNLKERKQEISTVISSLNLFNQSIGK